MYVGANEIPHAISLKLARDINSIQLYYDEIIQSISGKKQKKVITKKVVTDNSFKVGDKVLIVQHRPKDIMRNDSIIDWELKWIYIWARS
ncbi:MAG: hypothetical protein IPG90_12755 [Bacteroidetes bacterium]|nr:hypothetical protein [Bacteroidota bacterium]